MTKEEKLSKAKTLLLEHMDYIEKNFSVSNVGVVIVDDEIIVVVDGKFDPEGLKSLKAYLEEVLKEVEE